MTSNINLLYFLSSNIIYSVQKEHIKEQIFETFECSGQNSSHSYCEFSNGNQFLFKFCIIFHCHDMTSSVSFKPIHFLLWMKSSHQSPNFEIFQVPWWKFGIYVMSFSKPQVSFSSNFVSLVRVVKDNSSVLF